MTTRGSWSGSGHPAERQRLVSVDPSACRPPASAATAGSAALNEHLRLVLYFPSAAFETPAELAEVHIGVSATASLDRVAPVAVTRGVPLHGQFPRPGDASYVFTSEVLAVDDDAGPNLVRFAFPARIERVQSRRDVRLTTAFPVGVAVAGPRRLVAVDDGPAWRHARAVDLSAGGLGVLALGSLDPGATVMTRWDLPSRSGDVRMEVRAKVVRTVDSAEPDALGRRRYGLEFVDLPSSEQQHIVEAVLFQLSRRGRT